jgi:transposase-like protein
MKTGVNDLEKKKKQTDKRSVDATDSPEIEVVAKARRRRFTVSYKLKILQEVDNAGSGEVGKILRREGLYSSHLAKWRQQRREGMLVARKRGPKPKMDEHSRKELARLKRENARLNRRLNQAEKIIDIQKKISDILGIPLEETPTEED